jgi:RecB family endonuclease NucS
MTEQNVWKALERLAKSQEETDRQLKQTDQQLKERLKETDLQLKQTDRQLKESITETDRQIRQVNKQIGEIGNKFGRFTEGMAEPSMRKLLEQFGMTAIHPRALFHSEDRSRTLEVDVLGYDSNDLREEVYIVEVKSLLTPDSISQALKTIADFRELGPVALRHRPIYGVIAAVDIPKDVDRAVTSRGLYLARISDDTFQLLTPRGFKPKLFLHKTPGRLSNSRANGRPKKKKSRKN